MSFIKIGNTVVEYDLTFTNRKKTIGLRIDKNKRLKVNAPKGLSEEEVKVNLHKKAKWILNSLEKIEKIVPHEATKEFVSGEKFLLRGKEHRLKVLKSKDDVSPSLILQNGRFIATIPHHIPQSKYREHIRPLFVDYYHQQAERVLNKRVDEYLTYFDDTPASIKIKEYKSKWGSCSSKNKLSFNWQIVMAETSIIDYLVVHELCHMEHKNHSKNYWNAVEAIMPDYKERKKWLRVNGELLRI